MKCPACGAKTKRDARACGNCGAPLPEVPKPDYGPGVVGASDAETRWFVGPVLACIIVAIAIAAAVFGVVEYYHERDSERPDTTYTTTGYVPAITAGGQYEVVATTAEEWAILDLNQ